jgi:integrase
MRNPNGYGTVYKLPGNRRRPWIARVTTGWEWVEGKDGTKKLKQLYKIIGYFEEKPDAIVALADYYKNPTPLKATMTLKELYEEWSAGAFEYISRQTQDNYRAAWKRLSKSANVKVKELRTAHFQRVIDVAHKDGMSRSTLEKIRITAVAMMNYALENDVINKNYAEFIRLPKAEKVEKKRFTDLEVKKLEKAAENDEWVATVLIKIYTGARISELLGLTRFNVNLEAGLITGGIKTDAGKDRVIPIHPKIIKFVKQWHEKGGQRLICDEGKPLTAKKYREKFYYPALEAAGVRKLVPHKCRHTFGSMLAEAGVDTAMIQKLIGHSDYAFTANTYTHPEIKSLKEAINKI